MPRFPNKATSSVSFGGVSGDEEGGLPAFRPERTRKIRKGEGQLPKAGGGVVAVEKLVGEVDLLEGFHGICLMFSTGFQTVFSVFSIFFLIV